MVGAPVQASPASRLLLLPPQPLHVAAERRLEVEGAVGGRRRAGGGADRALCGTELTVELQRFDRRSRGARRAVRRGWVEPGGVGGRRQAGQQHLAGLGRRLGTQLTVGAPDWLTWNT